MSSYPFIHIDIPGYKQLKSLFPEKTAKLTHEITALLNRLGSLRTDLPFTCKLPPGLTDSLPYETFLNEILSLRRILRMQEKELCGFSIFLGTGRRGEEPFLPRFVYPFLKKVPPSGEIYFNTETYRPLQNMIRAEEAAADLLMFRQKRDSFEQSFHSKKQQKNMTRLYTEEDLAGILKDWDSLHRNHQGIQITGAGAMEKLNYIGCFLRQSGRQSLVFHAEKDQKTPYATLIHGLDRDLLEQYSKLEDLKPAFKAAASDILREQTLNPDRYELDFLEFFKEYLDLFTRENRKPLLILLQNPMILSREEQKILRYCMNELPHRRYIFILPSDRLPGIFSFLSFYRLKIRRISPNRISELLSSQFSLKKPSLEEIKRCTRKHRNHLLPALLELSSEEENERKSVSRLGLVYDKILYCLSTNRCLIEKKKLLSYLKQEWGTACQTYIEKLIRWEYISEDLRVLNPAHQSALEDFLTAEEKKEIRKNFLAFIKEEEKKQISPFFPDFFTRFSALLSPEDYLFFFEKRMFQYIRNHEPEPLKEHLKEKHPRRENFPDHLQEGFKNLVGTGIVFYYLLTRQFTKAREKLSTLGETGQNRPRNRPYEEYLSLVRAGLHYHTEDIPQNFRLDYSKDCLYKFQNHSNENAKIMAYLEISRSMLSRQKYSQGLGYLEFIHRFSVTRNNIYGILESRFLYASYHYMFESLSLALREVNLLLPLSRDHGLHFWTVLGSFLKGRILFELGLYNESAKIFNEGFESASQYSFPLPASVLRNWEARSCVYGRQFDRARTLLENPEDSAEALFFKAEFHYRKEELPQAENLLSKALKLTRNLTRFPLQNGIWYDGFVPVEGNFIPGDHRSGILFSHMNTLYFGIRGLRGNAESAVKNFFNFSIRNELRKNHFYHYLYDYFYAITSTHTEEKNDIKDESFIFSRLVKQLQARTSLIDDVELKQSYMHQNYWNRQIMKIAKRGKFI